MKITNKDIYDSIKLIEKKNDEAHAKLLEHQQKTNSKVSLNKWIATTAITLILAVGGMLGMHLTNAI